VSACAADRNVKGLHDARRDTGRSHWCVQIGWREQENRAIRAVRSLSHQASATGARSTRSSQREGRPALSSEHNCGGASKNRCRHKSAPVRIVKLVAALVRIGALRRSPSYQDTSRLAMLAKQKTARPASNRQCIYRVCWSDPYCVRRRMIERLATVSYSLSHAVRFRSDWCPLESICQPCSVGNAEHCCVMSELAWLPRYYSAAVALHSAAYYSTRCRGAVNLL
jgi:hypothetical protein